MPTRHLCGQFPVDHVLWTGRSLGTLREQFATAGFDSVAGGHHDHAPTENALIGFADGTYIELLAPVDPDADITRRRDLLLEDAGPAGWALSVTDIDSVAAAMTERGAPVDDPIDMGRAHPEGFTITWSIATLEPDPAGSVLPFLIADCTPREYRVPDPTVDSPIDGIDRVVLAVPDHDTILPDLNRAFDLPTPDAVPWPAMGATLYRFPDTALAVVVPEGNAGPIRSRLDRFGPGPLCFLLGTENMTAVRSHHPCTDTPVWPGTELTWIDAPGIPPGRLGVIGRESL